MIDLDMTSYGAKGKDYLGFLTVTIDGDGPLISCSKAPAGKLVSAGQDLRDYHRW